MEALADVRGKFAAFGKNRTLVPYLELCMSLSKMRESIKDKKKPIARAFNETDDCLRASSHVDDKLINVFGCALECLSEDMTEEQADNIVANLKTKGFSPWQSRGRDISLKYDPKKVANSVDKPEETGEDTDKKDEKNAG